MIPSLLGIFASTVGSRLLASSSAQKVHVLHAMPGRIRLQCQDWKGQVVSQWLEKSLQKHPLVQRVSASAVTGSLVLEFTVSHLTPAQLDELIRQAVEATVQAYPQKQASLKKSLKGTVGWLDRKVKERTFAKADLDSLLILLLLGKGIFDFRKNPTFSTGLLLWAYGLLTREEDKD